MQDLRTKQRTDCRQDHRKYTGQEHGVKNMTSHLCHISRTEAFGDRHAKATRQTNAKAEYQKLDTA